MRDEDGNCHACGEPLLASYGCYTPGCEGEVEYCECGCILAEDGFCDNPYCFEDRGEEL